MADDRRERYINPYTDFDVKKLFGTKMERRQYETSLKESKGNTDDAFLHGLIDGVVVVRASSC